MADNFLAVARTRDLIVQEMGPETLVFDRRTDVAHNLSPVAAIVWANCDGEHDIDALASLVAEIEPAEPKVAVEAALATLAEQDLLVDGVSRRAVMQRAAKYGAGALIVSVMAPAAAMATSPGQKAAGATCNQDNECSGNLECRLSNGNKANGGNGHCVTATCSTSTAKGSATVCGPTNGVNNQNYATSLCCSGVCKRDNGSPGSQPGTCQP